MERLVTIADAASGAVADIRVRCGADAVVGDLTPRLAAIVGSAAQHVAREGHLLPSGLPVADIVDGDLLTLTTDATSDAVGQERPVRPVTVPTGRATAPSYEAVTVTFPVAPQPAKPPRIPLLTTLVPLLLGFGLAVLLDHWEFAAFAALSPVVVLSQTGSERWHARRTARAATTAYAEARAEAEARLSAALRDEAQWRHTAAPPASADLASADSDLLWRFSPAPLQLRIGCGSVPASTRVDGADMSPKLDGVPVQVTLEPGMTVALRGDVAACRALGRSLLVQAALRHSPTALHIAIVGPGRPASWSWARWLPHIRTSGAADVAVTSDDVDVVAKRIAASNVPTLVLVDGVVTTSTTRFGELTTVVRLDDGPRRGADADVVVEVDKSGRAESIRESVPRQVLQADGLTVTDAEALARRLAAFTPADDASELPRRVRWADVQQLDLGSPAVAATTLLRRWQLNLSMRVPIGVSATGVATIDLDRDGPHALVAGTTGAGKSEFLKSLVAGLAAANSPRDLHLLLLDFKGGTAFGRCHDLPHVIDLLTDLDAASSTRVLTSLRAELRRRERLLSDAGASGLDSWPAGADGRPPRLVIVVDEFATLVHELPEFVSGLVDVAQRGRGLGVHLILATQRPQGVLSADIRANTRLRICLAVSGEAEARDVVDSALPAAIDIDTPGRAFIRVGSESLREVQTASVAASPQPHEMEVDLLPIPAWAHPCAAGEGEGPSQLEQLIAAARLAAYRAKLDDQQPPWLPPLPDHVALSELVAAEGTVAVGLVDQPDMLAQPPMTVSLDDCTPVLFAGGPRSGRTAAAVALVTALAHRLPPDELRVWGIDGSEGLGDLRSLPHTGSVVPARDGAQTERLLTYLEGEVDRRRAAGVTTPQLVLVVDSWEALVTDDPAHARSHDAVLQLAAGGASAGLRVVVTSGRSGLVGRLPSAIATRLCLRFADDADFALAGISPRQIPSALPPGRAIRASDGALLQLAVVDERAASRARNYPAPEVPPRRFDPLPRRVPLASLRGPGCVIVGVGGDDAAPVVIDTESTPTLLVAGAPGSGRSSTLLGLAMQIARRTVVVAAPTSSLAALPDVILIDPAGADPVASFKAAVVPGDAVLVDDIDLLDDPPLLDVVERALRDAAGDGLFVVVSATTEAAAAAFRGPLAVARRKRCGLLLRPDRRTVAELLGAHVDAPTGRSDPPGRGALVVRGTATTVQVADPR